MYNYLMYYTSDDSLDHCKYISAPDLDEAQKQMYAFMERENIYGDITDIKVSERRKDIYMDTETGELLTLQNVFDTYVINYPDREITFHEYLHNCCDKNGFLKEVRT